MPKRLSRKEQAGRLPERRLGGAERAVFHVENWSTSMRILCKACSEGEEAPV